MDEIEEANLTGFAKRLYTSGDRNCHQNSSRSLIINGNQMAYCSRDFAIFAGAAFGLVFCIWKRVELQAWLILVGIVPIGLDGGIQLLSHDMDVITFFTYESTNTVRMLTGSLTGFMTGAMLAFIGRTVGDGLLSTSWGKSYLEWRESKKGPKGKAKRGTGWSEDERPPSI